MKSNNHSLTKRYGLQTIDDKVSNLLKPIFSGSKKEFVIINNLVKNWQDIVGVKYAKFCAPKMVRFDKYNHDIKLTIAVFNSATGFFLENNSEIIIERIATKYGFKSINKIIIKQEPKEVELNLIPKKLAPDVNDKIDKKLDNIENKELAETLKKLAEEIYQ